ncbi:MAG: type 1 glutamine amidotransferase [Pseudomonadota bacterium]
MSRTVHIIEHWDTPPDAGQIHLRGRCFDVRVHHPWKGETLLQLNGDEAGLLVMGGPQMVAEHETWPYLADEFRLIEKAMALDVPVIGVCLGSQMIAHVLGAEVRYGDDPEAISMGFFESKSIDLNFMPAKMMTLNGNAQGWDLPYGAELLATSDETIHPNQVFSYGDNVLALQFHPEATRAALDNWHTTFAHLLERPGVQSLEEQLAGFDRWQGEATDWYLHLLDHTLR